VLYPSVGGSYLPSGYGSFVVFKEASRTDDTATNPEVTIHFEAVASGVGTVSDLASGEVVVDIR